ncbi:MAG: radical SAM protein, partial [Acidobacteria bacterium]|nr:radical SAM protein [Acidobacteriota bacterium]
DAGVGAGVGAGIVRADGGEAQAEPEISLARQRFVVPDRGDLPPLAEYAHLTTADGSRRTVGYTEATRGCKHLCRHCPVVPVYGGQFRVVQPEVVLADIEQQVAAGAEHITFGDPDFFNGPKHAAKIAGALHERHPDLTYDVTIKVEHLLAHAELLPLLRDTGCAFVTSAIESVDDRVLEILDKGHTRNDFVEVVRLFGAVNLALQPTFVAFTPWITLDGYADLLNTLVELDLIDNVPSIQLAIRLLIPAGSRLLELPEVDSLVGEFDPALLGYPWRHTDPRVDELQRDIEAVIEHAGDGASRREIFAQTWELLHRRLDHPAAALPPVTPGRPRPTIPYLSEPWYC